MNHTVRSFGLLFVLSIMLSTGSYAGTVAIKWNNVKQQIVGIGASVAAGRLYAYPSLYDLLFKDDVGIGLSIMRISVPSDMSAQAVGRHMEQLLAAKSRNPSIVTIACPWSPPGAWKTNDSARDGGELLPENYSKYANLLADFCLNLKKNNGIDVYALSVQNEPDVRQSYTTCLWNAQQYKTFVIQNLKPAFVQKNVQTKIMLGENSSWDEAVVVPTLTDPAGANAVDIVSAHDYGSYRVTPTMPVSKSKGKPVWMTEVSYPGNTDKTMSDGLRMAESIFDFFNEYEASAWIFWTFVSNNEGQGIIFGDGTSPPVIPRRLYTIGNYSKFIKTGYRHIETVPGRQADALVSAYKDPTSGKFVIVAVNKNSSSVSMTFNVDFAVSSVTPHLTTSTDNLTDRPAISVVNGSFTASLAGSSVTTFTGTSGTPTNARLARSALPMLHSSIGSLYTVRGQRIGDVASAKNFKKHHRGVYAVVR